MYLYNISIIVENENHEILMNWVKDNWFKTLAIEPKFLKMMDSPHPGHTYSVQFNFEHAADIPKFQQEKVILLQEYISTNHHEKAFIFDSIMKYL